MKKITKQVGSIKIFNSNLCFIGGTPPINSHNTYAWERIGYIVYFMFSFQYETLGTGLVGIEVDLPPDMPEPSDNYMDVNNKIEDNLAINLSIIAIFGGNKRKYLWSKKKSTIETTTRSFIKKNPCNYSIKVITKKGNYSNFQISGWYETDKV